MIGFRGQLVRYSKYVNEGSPFTHGYELIEPVSIPDWEGDFWRAWEVFLPPIGEGNRIRVFTVNLDKCQEVSDGNASTS